MKLWPPSRPSLTGLAAGGRLVTSSFQLGKHADIIWDVIPTLFATVSAAAMELDTDSVQSVDLFKQPGNPAADEKMQPSTPQRHGGARLHEFVSKTVTIAVFGAEPTLCSAGSTC